MVAVLSTWMAIQIDQRRIGWTHGGVARATIASWRRRRLKSDA
jgi:hypothetical protein